MKRIGPAVDVPPGAVIDFEDHAVGNAGGEYFATSRRCRHLGADLAQGSISPDGCLVCPWHGSEYDVRTGQMVKGPGGVFAKFPGLGASFKALTRAVPLRIRTVIAKGDDLYLDD